MKRKSSLILLLFLSAIILGCKKEKEDDHDHNDGVTISTFVEFDHKMGTKPFELNKEYSNSHGVKFKLTRLEYYLTMIALKDHSIRSTDDYEGNILVRPPETKLSLGKIKLPHVHNLSMTIGVHEDLNHLDPNTYKEGHPLAIQSPAMHWSWSNGYRFVVIEGEFDSDGDDTPDKSIFFHIGLDEMARTFEGSVHKDVKEGEDFVIKFSADYMKLFDSLNLLEENNTSTLGEKELAAKVADNFAKVFTILI